MTSSQPDEKFGTIDSIETLLKEVKDDQSHFGNKSGLASIEEVEKITENILTQIKVPINDKNKNKVLATIAVLVQEGATSPRFADSYACDVFGIEISVKNLRKATSDNKTTVRKLACAIRHQAISVATNLGIEGNLAKTFKLQHQDYQPDEKGFRLPNLFR